MLLGHSNIDKKAVYLQFNDRDLQDVYEGVPERACEKNLSGLKH
jgi:hypothetical protein